MLPNISTATVHRQGTGHKRCPVRARRANVSPYTTSHHLYTTFAPRHTTFTPPLHHHYTTFTPPHTTFTPPLHHLTPPLHYLYTTVTTPLHHLTAPLQHLYTPSHHLMDPNQTYINMDKQDEMDQSGIHKP